MSLPKCSPSLVFLRLSWKDVKPAVFVGGLDDNEQQASSYLLPMGDTSADILAVIDDPISSTTTGMQLKKVYKLLPYPGGRIQQFCQFKGEEVVKFRSLNCHVTELAGILSVENLVKTDLVLSSSEAEDR